MELASVNGTTLNDPNPVYDEVRKALRDPSKEPEVTQSRRERQRARKYAQEITDEVCKEVGIHVFHVNGRRKRAVAEEAAESD